MEFTTKETGRLDALIAAQDATLSRSRIQKVIKAGGVLVNSEKITKPSHQLHEGDIVTIIAATKATEDTTSIKPIDQQLEVLYEDDACMVINKPAGISVHPGHAMEEDEKTLLNGIAYLFVGRDIPFTSDAVLVHRLDKPTTGCIIVAKNYNSFLALQKQFEERTNTKQYLAIVAGVPEHESATIDAPIGRNLTNRTRMSVLQTSVSKEAKTDYEVLDATSDVALLKCTLHTGRTHQIRVHLSSVGHPILGDDTYGNGASGKITEHYKIHALCLHARRIGFVSPADSKEHFVKSPLSPTFSQVLTDTRLSLPVD